MAVEPNLPSAYNPSPMTSQRPIRAASVTGVRRRGAHTLAPEHLGEATAAATLAVIVGGVALVITGIGVIALALTMGARFGGDPPPDVASYGVVPLIGGIGAVLLGAGLTAGGLAVIGNARGARLITGILALLAAALAALGTVLVMVNQPRRHRSGDRPDDRDARVRGRCRAAASPSPLGPMARTVLLAATIVWLAAGVIGIGIGLLGSTGLQRLLPPLAIDLAALGGAVVAVSLGILAVGVAHAVIVVGLRAGRAAARSAALLLAATLSALLVALAAASATSAMTVPDRAPSLMAACAAALVGVAAYGLVTVQLVAEMRASRAR